MVSRWRILPSSANDKKKLEWNPTGGGGGVPRSRLVSVGVRVDVVVPRSDGGVLRSGVVFVRRRLRHRTLRRIPALLRRRRRAVGWSDVLLDAIGVGWGLLLFIGTRLVTHALSRVHSASASY